MSATCKKCAHMDKKHRCMLLQPVRPDSPICHMFLSTDHAAGKRAAKLREERAEMNGSNRNC